MLEGIVEHKKEKNIYLLNLFFCSVRDHLFSTSADFSKKSSISYPIARIHKCAYQGARNVGFSENVRLLLRE